MCVTCQELTPVFCTASSCPCGRAGVYGTPPSHPQSAPRASVFWLLISLGVARTGSSNFSRTSAGVEGLT